MKTILESDSDYICDIEAPCFQLLLPEEVELVRSCKTQVLFRKGDSLTKQGAFSSYVLFVIKGMARQYLEGEGGRSFNLRIIQPGQFVGLSSVFTGNVFAYSSVALTDCQVYLIEKSAIKGVIEQNGHFGFHLIGRYMEQNGNLFDALRNVVFKQMHGRMADTLLYLDAVRSEHPELFPLLSRRDIADFAGISMESAVKLLKSFEKEGLIRLEEREIWIENRDSLLEISKKG
ncbi:MAG: Crp/Fnr family transcriptional regulator [Marinilabiliales bacterium]|nr:Crp/Fnr family transcriptional regulator [Marinilabiliales bacterium]